MKNLIQPVSNGSMADIAFLLLIFFLISTTIELDKGIVVKLPPIDNIIQKQPLARNILSVLVNANNDLLVRGKPILIDELTATTKEFIMNPNNKSNMAQKPSMAIVSLKNDRGTRYGTYIHVYNELKAAYNQLWDEECRASYGYPYSNNLPIEMALLHE